MATAEYHSIEIIDGVDPEVTSSSLAETQTTLSNLSLDTTFRMSGVQHIEYATYTEGAATSYASTSDTSPTTNRSASSGTRTQYSTGESLALSQPWSPPYRYPLEATLIHNPVTEHGEPRWSISIFDPEVNGYDKPSYEFHVPQPFARLLYGEGYDTGLGQSYEEGDPEDVYAQLTKNVYNALKAEDVSIRYWYCTRDKEKIRRGVPDGRRGLQGKSWCEECYHFELMVRRLAV